MRTHLHCGQVFDSRLARFEPDITLVFEAGRVVFAGPSAAAPPFQPGDTQVDHSRHWVLPGLIDQHVHLSYGEAKTEEDIDLFASVEFRALRGMEAAQRVLRAGFTSITDPTTTGRVSLAIRDAIHAGLFRGPRLSCSGQNISTRQGLVDWYPTWIGVPDTSIGRVIKSVDEGIEAIRVQVKDGVDIVKFAMDGDSMNPSSVRLAAAFSQDEITRLVAEAHRLGRKVVVHARGGEGVLYAARAGVDLVFHASWMDERALEAVVKAGCSVCPTLSLLINNIEFTQPTDGSHASLVDAHKRELEAAVTNLQRARAAGVTFMLGSEAGFAVTPYGEWHARELDNHVKYLGFSAAEVLQQATRNNAEFHRDGRAIGALAVGCFADAIALTKSPLDDIRCLQDPSVFDAIYLGGDAVDRRPNAARRRLASEFSYALWGEVYTRERVKSLRLGTATAAVVAS